MTRSTKERCEHCGKLLRLGDKITIHAGQISASTPRNKDGTLKRSREIEYKKTCTNPRCPGSPEEETE